MGTLGVAGYLEAVEKVRQLARAAGKRTYTILMGKPSPAKLANFPEIDVFVMVADPQVCRFPFPFLCFPCPCVPFFSFLSFPFCSYLPFPFQVLSFWFNFAFPRKFRLDGRCAAAVKDPFVT